MDAHIYRQALKSCLGDLMKMSSPKGMEKVIHRALAAQLPHSRNERKLREVGAKQTTGSADGRVDIVDRTHGIELKVVRLPRLNVTPSNALYDVGQLSSDYWRLSTAQKLTSAEIVVLLFGPLVAELGTEAAIYREFHNRMFVDYATSMTCGELRQQKGRVERKRQIAAIERMGFSVPCGSRCKHRAFKDGSYCVVSIAVEAL